MRHIIEATSKRIVISNYDNKIQVMSEHIQLLEKSNKTKFKVKYRIINESFKLVTKSGKARMEEYYSKDELFAVIEDIKEEYYYIMPFSKCMEFIKRKIKKEDLLLDLSDEHFEQFIDNSKPLKQGKVSPTVKLDKKNDSGKNNLTGKELLQSLPLGEITEEQALKIDPDFVTAIKSRKYKWKDWNFLGKIFDPIYDQYVKSHNWDVFPSVRGKLSTQKKLLTVDEKTFKWQVVRFYDAKWNKTPLRFGADPEIIYQVTDQKYIWLPTMTSEGK